MTMTEREWQAWHLDAEINRRGLPIDLDLVQAAIAIDTENRGRLMARAMELMGIENPNSRDQFLDWLRGEEVDVDTLRKADVASLRAGDLEPHVREALEIRSELSKSSTKKYYALADATGSDGRLRGCFQFNGAARTGRWAGRLFQPQNLPRGTIKPDFIGTARASVKTGDFDLLDTLYESVSDVLVSCVRTAIAAPPRKALVVADYASIETVMIAWAAECPTLLDVFRSGRDAYKDMAARLFKIPYDRVSKEQRNYAKPIVLGCGYMLGAKGMIAYAQGYGVEMTEADAQAAVAAYRDGYPEVAQFWRLLDAAARRAIENPGKIYKAGRFRFKVEADFLLLRLPSERKLAYYKPEINPGGRYGPEITYMGRDYGNTWDRINTHPGKICENVIQAVARDLLVDGLFHASGDIALEIVGHVHDEILALADADDEGALDRLMDAMRRMPAWAADAPVGAAGWIGQFYCKQ
jgi:DNA polymerase